MIAGFYKSKNFGLFGQFVTSSITQCKISSLYGGYQNNNINNIKNNKTFKYRC